MKIKQRSVPFRISEYLLTSYNHRSAIEQVFLLKFQEEPRISTGNADQDRRMNSVSLFCSDPCFPEACVAPLSFNSVLTCSEYLPPPVPVYLFEEVKIKSL